MTMKKSMIAVAVAGAVGAPLSAAQAAEAYGFINVGVDALSLSDGAQDTSGASALVFVSGNDGTVHLTDTAESRFGFKGSEDLGNGLTAGYRFEFGIGTEFGAALPLNGGAPVEDSVLRTRLSNVSLSGDFGMVKLGTQWGTLYEYLGWNVYRSDSNGGAAWYYSTSGGSITGSGAAITNDNYGLRVSNAISYTYGAGGYGSDPFTFTVQAMLDPDSGTGAAENDELLDATVIAAQGVFGDITVNGAVYQENDSSSGAAEPSITGIGVNFTGVPDLYVGGNFIITDFDTASPNDDELETLNVLATYDFGGGNSGMAGVGSGDSGDFDRDLSTYFLQYNRQLSSSTKVYVEYEWAEVENGSFAAAGQDAESSVLSVNMKHSF